MSPIGPAPDRAALTPLLACPRCRSPLTATSGALVCTGAACAFAAGFPEVSGQPVLIDFEQSIFRPEAYADGRGSVLARDDAGVSLRTRLRRILTGPNRTAPRVAAVFLHRLKADASGRPNLLVIGSGTLGSGAEALYHDDTVQLIGLDVYASPFTGLVADGHRLPFADGVIDGVWIQAVLEHVLEPHRVVSEIERVLRPGGLVYADTPFMQPVHEAAYDFTRFSLSGHRWLFRGFTQIEAGAVGGAGTALVRSIRYFLRALGLGDTLSALATLPFFWLRLLDGAARRGPNADAADGVYFLGEKAAASLRPSDMPAYFDEQR